MSEIATTKETVVPVGTWAIDRHHSRLGFSIRHLGVNNVRGRFNNFEGTLTVEDRLEDSVIDVTIMTASIDTGDSDRDKHLCSEDFFDAEHFPTIRFQSLTINPRNWGDMMIIGDLTMHGVSNQLELEGELYGRTHNEQGTEMIGLGLAGSLSRGDYGMKFNQLLGGGNLLVGDEVKLEIDIAATRLD